jgi:hypothetical protein
MIKKIMSVDNKKNADKKPKNKVRHKRAATRDLKDIKASLQLPPVKKDHRDSSPGDKTLNPEDMGRDFGPGSEDFSDSTKDNIRKARIRGFGGKLSGPNTMRDDMDFMQPKEGLSAELHNSRKSSNPQSMDQSRMNESGVLCCICFDNPPDAVFMDCGHGGVCYDCSLDIWKTTEECYLCRAVNFFFYNKQENCTSSAV